jgi:hypothetical protein
MNANTTHISLWPTFHANEYTLYCTLVRNGEEGLEGIWYEIAMETEY